ncbi:MAG TPA: VWA domain-containing protein [Vicinamibacterales bacterium]|nr:VWA domain-containing protein [Vicinamibacterales bacterium]
MRGPSVVVLLVMAVSAAAAQKGTLRSSIELTVVTATVRDADGKLATDLPRESFEIYEDGTRVPVAQFTHERVPLGLGLLLDISDSMYGQRIKDAESAVERFLLHLLAPSDAFFVVAFNHEPHVLFGWQTAADGVHEALEKLKPSGSTAIYDALVAALPFIDNRPRERAAIVLITDGDDTASDTTLHDLRPALVRSDAFVYAIAIDTPEARWIAHRVNVQTLNEITGQSGGRTEVVRDTADLESATASIAEELNSQYVLGYSSPHPGDGQYHSIRVRVTGGAYKVRARNGYVAVKRGSQ